MEGVFGYVGGQAVDAEPEAQATQASGITAEQWVDGVLKRVRELAETDWCRYDELAAPIGYREAAAS
ncbi:hypothetical protein ACFY1U_49245 [Streptomyces sp. NPDC001351]|uniref:hypothetical protein n=1 Tax=Streptomyces sp. NPDC001351 TaxID=3364564 RepID=UPI0036CF129C